MDTPIIPEAKVTTDRYGITRQLVTNYSHSPDLPGAVLIPSHKGNYGAQLGKREPIPMVIDPEYFGNSVVITPAALDANRALLSGTDDPSDIYKAITNAAKTKKTEVIDPMAKKAKQTELDVAADTPAPSRRRRRAAAKTTSKTSAKPAAAPTPNQPTAASEPSKAAPETPKAPAPEQPVSQDPPITLGTLQTLLGEFAAGIKCDIAEIREEVADIGSDVDDIMAQPEVSDTIAEAAEPPQPAAPESVTPAPPAPVPSAVAAPQVSVTLTFPGSNFEITSKYHSVIQSGGTLVLVYNSAYEAGDRVTPAVDLDNPYKIMAVQRDGTPAVRCNGLYMGQRFSHNGYDYILFAVPDGVDGDEDA